MGEGPRLRLGGSDAGFFKEGGGEKAERERKRQAKKKQTKTPSSKTSQATNDWARYGLGSPPKGAQALSIEIVEARMESDGFGHYVRQADDGSEVSLKARAVFFLYGREFLMDNSKGRRVEMVNRILNSKSKFERLQRVLDYEGDVDVTTSHSSSSASALRAGQIVLSCSVDGGVDAAAAKTEGKVPKECCGGGTALMDAILLRFY